MVRISTKQVFSGLEMSVVMDGKTEGVSFTGTGTISMNEAFSTLRQALRVLEASRQIQSQAEK